MSASARSFVVFYIHTQALHCLPRVPHHTACARAELHPSWIAYSALWPASFILLLPSEISYLYKNGAPEIACAYTGSCFSIDHATPAAEIPVQVLFLLCAVFFAARQSIADSLNCTNPGVDAPGCVETYEVLVDSFAAAVATTIAFRFALFLLYPSCLLPWFGSATDSYYQQRLPRASMTGTSSLVAARPTPRISGESASPPAQHLPWPVAAGGMTSMSFTMSQMRAPPQPRTTGRFRIRDFRRMATGDLAASRPNNPLSSVSFPVGSASAGQSDTGSGAAGTLLNPMFSPGRDGSISGAKRVFAQTVAYADPIPAVWSARVCGSGHGRGEPALISATDDGDVEGGLRRSTSADATVATAWRPSKLGVADELSVSGGGDDGAASATHSSTPSSSSSSSSFTADEATSAATRISQHPRHNDARGAHDDHRAASAASSAGTASDLTSVRSSRSRRHPSSALVAAASTHASDSPFPHKSLPGRYVLLIVAAVALQALLPTAILGETRRFRCCGGAWGCVACMNIRT